MGNLANPLMILLVVLIASASAVSAFNITRLLDQHSDFSNFNNMLTETGVAEAVNGRQTITVLAVDNSAMGGLNGGGKDFVRNVMATHVVLDYYDMDKLGELNKNHSALLTTLFQSTGLANGRQGFLNVTVNRDKIVFGSAVQNARHDSQLVDVVAAQPFNISVLQVSSIIVPPGFDQNHDNSPPAKAPPPRKVGPPEPTPAPTSSDAPAADSPADDDSPADSPDADDDSDAPSSGPSPGPAPAPASGPSPAPGPGADEAADKKDDKKSGGMRVTSSGLLAAAAVALVSTLAAL